MIQKQAIAQFVPEESFSATDVLIAAFLVFVGGLTLAWVMAWCWLSYVVARFVIG